MKNNQQINRYDQRDNLPSRSRLASDSKEYKAYYAMHPELEEMDKKIRIHFNEELANAARLKNFPEEWLANAWVHGTKKSTTFLLRNAVDGPVNKEKLEVDPAAMSWKIKGLAKYLGAGKVGIGLLNQKWVYSHQGYHAEGWGEPVEVPHKYSIVMAFPHTWDTWLTGGKTGIPSFMDDWHLYNLMASAGVRLATAIRDMGYPARAHIQSNYGCILPPLAVDAGLGEQCRIGLCLTREYGIAFRLCAVTTDLPLIPDPPANLGIENFCRRCTKCADVCPSGAISKGEKIEIDGLRIWKQDVYKCFRYWNAKGAACTMCRRACPWSKPRTMPHKIVSTLAKNVTPLIPFFIWADNIVYGKKPRYYPPPKWLQGEDQKMSPGKKLLYWFDHR